MRTPLVRSSLLALTMLMAALVAVGAPVKALAREPGPGSGLRPGPVLLVPSPGVGEALARSSPKVLEAIQRDMRLTRAEAITRIGRQHAAGAVEARAHRAAGRHFAGSWLNSDGSALMVAVTDQQVAPAVRAAGATPALVRYRRGELEAARLKLRDHADKLRGTAVHGWQVDLARNRLVVAVAPGKQSAAATWVAGAGVPAGLVAYERSIGPVKPTAEVLGGDAFDSSRDQCTLGFGVSPPSGVGTNGFVTAGHCAFLGDPIFIGGQAAGATSQSSFPATANAGRGFDRAFVRLDENNPPLPLVRTDDFGSAIPVLGSQAARRQGDMLCSFGKTSKYRCGPLIGRGRDARILFTSGIATIIGVNDVGFCGSGGDSGGPVITAMGGQAQGTVVGDTCSTGSFATQFQPINQTLRDFRLKLLKATGGPPIPAPTITEFFCYAAEHYPNPFSCELYWEGGTDPDQVQVSSNGSQAKRFNDFDDNFVSISGRCFPSQDTYVSMSVFDADGRRADATLRGFCPRG